MTRHIIDQTRVHHRWDASLQPSLEVDSGDVVAFDLAMAGRGQVHENDRIEDTSFDFDTLYNLLGPVWVNGASPGRTLQVEVLALETGPWGWTVILPDLGLLPDDFPDPYLRTFDLRERNTAELTDEISVPLRPFLGTMGVHPGEPAVAAPFPPHRGGGNIDNRHLIVGSMLLLPIWCEGALFSCGDPHAAQGDGEVCVSGIECDMHATLRLSVLEHPTPSPMYIVPETTHATPGYFGTMGIANDLLEGSRAAVRAMIAWLVEYRHLTREDAYVLCSLAGDLRIHEVVDAGIWNVGFTLPSWIGTFPPGLGLIERA
jgi:acetamidase/formamidase